MPKLINKKLIRPIVFIFLTIILYFIVFYKLLFQTFLLQSLIYILLFFIFFHFAYLELYKFKQKYLIIILIILSIIEMFFVWATNIYIILSILILNSWIFLLANNLKSESDNKIKFNSIWYFSVWWYVFTVFVTIGYSLNLFWTYNQFPFTCQNLSQYSNQVIDFVTKPFKLWLQEANNRKQSTTIFFESNIKDLIKIWNNIKIDDNNSKYKIFLKTLNNYKKTMIDATLKENNDINIGMCDYILQKVKQEYNKTWFRISIILLLFLLLYWFVRIVFWATSIISFFLFKILYRCKVYKIKTEKKDIEKIM